MRRLIIASIFFFCIVPYIYGSGKGHKYCSKSDKIEILPDWALGNFIRPKGVNPVINPNSRLIFHCPMKNENVKWAESDVFNPSAVVKDGEINILFRAEDNSAIGIGSRTSRIGLATSSDGIHMNICKNPVLFPGGDKFVSYETPGGCEDPRIAVTKDGLYVMTYTMWNRKNWMLGVATSRDLVHWIKHGPAFYKAYNGKYKNLGCKSGALVTKIVNGKQVIVKVKGRYLMYWGEEAVHAAWSDDLINWTPVEDSHGKLLVLIHPRNYYFDSMLTECGPPAIVTDKGILLLYNGKNRTDIKRDVHYNPGTYSAGQVLFDLEDPFKAIERLKKPFFYPTESFEKNGQYVDGTVFIEGLAFFKNKWYLYYGCADSKIGVAVYDPVN